MLQYIFDTDHLTLFQLGNAAVGRRLANQPVGAVAIGVVTAEESLRGRLAQLARARDGPARIRSYNQLVVTLQAFTQFPIVAYDEPVEVWFQQLRSIRIGSQDLKIASIALSNQLTLITRNRRDFSRIHGLSLEDWSE
jgi:tRNA(fMet)-specific endonuclease VapC